MAGKQKIIYFKKDKKEFLQHNADRIAANRAQRDAATKKPSVGSRILSGIGNLGHALAPHLEQARRTGGKVQRYARQRSEAIDHNFGIGQFNPNIGAGLMDMRFPNSGFDRPAAPKRRRRRRTY
jgi:hypothetical protein